MKKLLIGIFINLTFSLMTLGQTQIEKSNTLQFDRIVVTSQQPKNKTFWFDIGIGPFVGRKAFGLSIMGLSFGYAIENNLLALKMDYNYDVSNQTMFDVFYTQHQPDEYFYDLEILYGILETYNKVQFSLSAGIGILGGAMNGKYSQDGSWRFYTKGYEIKKFNTMNFPVEAQFNLIATPHFGLGLNLFANLNTKRFLGGFLWKFRWGKLK